MLIYTYVVQTECKAKAMEQELKTAQAASASIKDDASATVLALADEVGAAHSAGYTVAVMVALLALVI